MTLKTPAPPDSRLRVPLSPPPPRSELGDFLRRGVLFTLFGLLLYAGLYAGSEWLIQRYAQKNRFFVVQAAAHAEYDYVILGASRAAALDYRDMNARLEEMTGSRILNLSTLGGGVTVNRFLLDYFFATRDTRAVVYVLDSFAFYAPDWNEQRLTDNELYLRAPWDAALARQMLRDPAARPAALGYISGFAKINNSKRFEPDVAAAEGSTFDRTYRPVPQIDRQRIEYLYPSSIDPEAIASSPYLAELERMIEDVRARGSHFIVIRPPVPERFLSMIPHEDAFNRELARVLARHEVEVHDHTRVNNEPELFYDSDHLNQTGVLSWFENHLAAVLAPR
jgi:hypothetical protein